MKRRLSKRERALVAVGAVAIGASWIVIDLFPRWRAWRAEARSYLENVEQAAAESATLLRALPQVIDSLTMRGEALGARMGDYVIESSSEAAGAQLASIISDAAASADVRLDVTSVSADSVTDHGIATLRTVVRGAGDTRGLVTWLVGLEAGTPLLRVERLSLTQPDAGAGLEQPEELSFELTLVGLHLQRAPSETS